MFEDQSRGQCGWSGVTKQRAAVAEVNQVRGGLDHMVMMLWFSF